MAHATVGVVIPAKNEQQFIGRCVATVLAAGADVDLDLVVVDNESQDETVAIAAATGARVVHSDSTSIGEVRNVGAAAVRGDIIAYIDADCEAPIGWIHDALAAFADTEVAAVAGHLDVPQDANWVQASWALPRREESKAKRTVVGASFFVRRATFDRLGGFDPRLKTGEDTDIARRLLEHGVRIQPEPRCNVVHHGYPSTLTGIIDRQIWQVQGQLGRRGFWDRSVVVACGFAAAAVLAVGSAIDGNLVVATLAAMATAAAPASFMISRMRRSRCTITADFVLKQYLISTVYLVGRALGVVIATTRLPYRRGYK